jgi:hypothetical protein
MVRKLGQSALPTLGIAALPAGDGVEAMEVFRRHELPDAIRRALAGEESLSGSPDTRAACPPTDTGSRKNSHGTWRSDDEHAEPLAVAICT